MCIARSVCVCVRGLGGGGGGCRASAGPRVRRAPRPRISVGVPCWPVACALHFERGGETQGSLPNFHLCPVAPEKKSVKGVVPSPRASRRHSRGLKHRENHAKFKGKVAMHGIYLSVCLYAWYEFPSACPLGLPKGAATSHDPLHTQPFTHQHHGTTKTHPHHITSPAPSASSG